MNEWALETTDYRLMEFINIEMITVFFFFIEDLAYSVPIVSLTSTYIKSTYLHIHILLVYLPHIYISHTPHISGLTYLLIHTWWIDFYFLPYFTLVVT